MDQSSEIEGTVPSILELAGVVQQLKHTAAWWLDSIIAAALLAGEKAGYLKRISTTQVEWTAAGANALHAAHERLKTPVSIVDTADHVQSSMLNSQAQQSNIVFPVLFEVDPASGEATGTVMPFCSAECRDACSDSSRAGLRKASAGMANATDFGYDPHCEQCGRDIKEVVKNPPGRNPVGPLVVDGTDKGGQFLGDGEYPPFVVFNVSDQEIISGPFDTRAEGEACIAAIQAGLHPQLDSDKLAAILKEIDTNGRKMPGLRVNVRRVAKKLDSPEDEGVAGIYEVFFNASVEGQSKQKLASIALDIFHAHQAIDCLDDFEIDVIDENNKVVAEDDSHAAYSASDKGMVNKIDEHPIDPRSSP